LDPERSILHRWRGVQPYDTALQQLLCRHPPECGGDFSHIPVDSGVRVSRPAFLRRLERTGRRVLRRCISPDPTILPPKCVPSGVKLNRILLMRWDAIGDMVVSLPLFRRLRELHPGTEIGIVASRRNAGLLRYEEGFRVLLWDRNPGLFLRSLAAARRFAPDAVVDTRMHYDSTTSYIYGMVSGAPWTVSATNRDQRLPFSVRVPVAQQGRHIVELISEVLSALGADLRLEDLDRRLRFSGREREFADGFWRSAGLSLRDRAVVLNLSARDPRKSWGGENSVKLLRMLGSRGYPTVVISAPADRQELVDIAEAGGALAAPESPDVLSAAALLEGGRLLVTPDTAMVHVAAAHQLPVVGLYAQGEPHMPLWYPWQVPMRTVVTSDPTGVKSISVGDVMNSVCELLAETGGG